MEEPVVTITYKGKVYTDPSLIKIRRNENTEPLCRLLENYIPKKDKAAK